MDIVTALSLSVQTNWLDRYMARYKFYIHTYIHTYKKSISNILVYCNCNVYHLRYICRRHMHDLDFSLQNGPRSNENMPKHIFDSQSKSIRQLTLTFCSRYNNLNIMNSRIHDVERVIWLTLDTYQLTILPGVPGR